MSACGSAISVCGPKRACRCSAMPCCCAAWAAPAWSRSRISWISHSMNASASIPRSSSCCGAARRLRTPWRPRCWILLAKRDGRSVTRILLVGCGKMGGALLAGWLEQGISPADAVIVDPHYDAKAGPAGIRSVASPEALPADFAPDVVLLAVKPQTMNQAAPSYRRFAESAVFLSIAAGRTLASLEAVLGEDAAIVRAMPNIPAAVRRGATGLLANRNVSDEQRRTCDLLVAAVGKAVWVEHEKQLDAVTALSGSGPAYVFLLVEALA